MFRQVFLIFLVCAGIVACQKSSDSPAAKEANNVDETLVLKVTKENFINGKKFCDLYVNNSDTQSKEYGKRISVPKDYSDKAKGNIEIYAYTRAPFNPQLPTFIFVDGGPGQNTHQLEDLIPHDKMNQINFDQRGVGCSAPDSWEEYSDSSLYSSVNTIKDMEEIRKAFGLNTWSIYGVSYGTVPSTMYASINSKVVNSLLLEGVVGSIEDLGRYSYRAEKWNLVVNAFNKKQKEAFEEVLFGSEEKGALIGYFLGQAGYADAGFKQLRDNVLFKLFPEEGGFNNELYAQVKEKLKKRGKKFNTPQQPGAVDENILTILYCKELGAFDKDQYTLGYNAEQGFYEKRSYTDTWRKDCEKHQIEESAQVKYDILNYPVSVPVYYMQGSHDAATVATGAMKHWKGVPKGESYFMLSLKGGHNPGLSKLGSEDKNIKQNQQDLYLKSLKAEKITPDFLSQLNESIVNGTNKYDRNVTWKLFTKYPADSYEVEKEFEGIKRSDNLNSF